MCALPILTVERRKQFYDAINNWHESEVKLLNIPAVVGRSEQLKAFADYAQKRVWEDGDKDLSEFVDEFLRL